VTGGEGIALALVATGAYNAGFVLEKRALARLPAINIGQPRQLLRTLFSAPAWVAGFLCTVFGLGCQTLVLGMLPISVVQPLQAGGIAVLLVLAWALLGERPTTRDAWRLAAVVLSVMLLGLSLDSRTKPGTQPPAGDTMIVVLGLSLLLAMVLYWIAHRVAGKHHLPATGVSAGLATGLVYGMSGLGLKGLSGELAHRSVGGILGVLPFSPYLYLVIGSSAGGMALFQTALQRCRASVVIPTSNVAGSCYVLVLGTWLFHETLPTDPSAFALRTGGFAVAVLALVIQPSSQVRPSMEGNQPWHWTNDSSTSSPAPLTREPCCISPMTRRSTTPACAGCIALRQMSR
jgi:drug/metabolite transporter (DMT)-like permease